MGFLKFLRGRLTALPEETSDGNIYITKNDGNVFVDVGNQRLHLNPPANWNETTTTSPAYVANKPELGDVASKDVDEYGDGSEASISLLDTKVPTSKLVYHELNALDAKIETVRSGIGHPYNASAVADMLDTDKVYIYTGDEAGMSNGHWYYYDESQDDWIDGGAYNSSVITTDTTLLVPGRAADAAATGNQITELKSETEDLYSRLNAITSAVESLEVRADSFAEDMEVTGSGYAYFLNNGSRIGGPYGPFAGNGGSGSGGGGGDIIDAVFSADKVTVETTYTISDGDDVWFEFDWESLENGVASGRGVVTITVNNNVKATLSVPQGNVKINLKNYYGTGTNKIRIRIADQYDQGKNWIVNVEVISLVIESYFDTSFPFNEAFNFTYIPYGNISKTVYFDVDGTTIGNTTTSITSRQLSYTIPAQTHGAHTLDVYFESEVNGETVRSNTLHYEFMFVVAGYNAIIITSPFTDTNQVQYSSVQIPFMVYNPNATEAEVNIYAGSTLLTTLTVNREIQYYTYVCRTPGTVLFKIASGIAEKVITFTVEAAETELAAETDALALYLTAEGRNNGEDNPGTWTYNSISATFTNFEWKLDGWQNDSEGNDVLRVIGDARVSIPYQIFGSDFKTTGKTIEIEFATRDVVNYNTPIITCKSGGVGLEITPQVLSFAGAQTTLDTQYKDNEHIRLSIVIQKQNENRLILFYINGIMSRAIQYISGERFTQLSPVGITIGSDTCGVDIYNIRVYDNSLARDTILMNWIADTSNGELKLARYQHNDVYDAYGGIAVETLPTDLPYMIISAEELPQYKGHKKTVSVTYTDPIDSTKSFTAEGVEIDVQGTSSAPYFRKNYDMKYKKGFSTTAGIASTYALRTGSIPFNRFVIKADVASSESANNTKLTMFYNDLCPYKTPAMQEDSRVRWGIEGVPIVMFWYDTVNQVAQFMGKQTTYLPM